jgi:hypothetical protein
MTPAQERAFKVKAEKMLKGHRMFPNGRDFRCFTERFRADNNEDFREKYDETFPDAPGSPGWFDKKFGRKKH